jgi:hypothetical protein
MDSISQLMDSYRSPDAAATLLLVHLPDPLNLAKTSNLFMVNKEQLAHFLHSASTSSTVKVSSPHELSTSCDSNFISDARVASTKYSKSKINEEETRKHVLDELADYSGKQKDHYDQLKPLKAIPPKHLSPAVRSFRKFSSVVVSRRKGVESPHMTYDEAKNNPSFTSTRRRHISLYILGRMGWALKEREYFIDKWSE